MPNSEAYGRGGSRWAPFPGAFLERATTLTLVLVLLSVAWMVASAFQPDWLRLVPLEVEVIVMLVLLSSALLLVSLVALWHTRT